MPAATRCRRSKYAERSLCDAGRVVASSTLASSIKRPASRQRSWMRSLVVNFGSLPWSDHGPEAAEVETELFATTAMRPNLGRSTSCGGILKAAVR